MGENNFAMSVQAASIDETMLAKINKHTRRSFNAEELFVFEGTISDDSLDSFDTRMDPETTLKNYADDLTRGISLMSGHATDKEPFGRSFDSSVRENGELTQVIGHFYMLRDSTSNGQSTNDIIRNIEGGIIRDMSVGFMAGVEDYVCSADGKTMMMSPYFPGDRMENGEKVFYWIKNAHLREVSTVYKGSNPNAYIEKARQIVSDGLMDENRIAVLQQGLGTRFDELDKSFFDAFKNNKRGVEDSKMKIADVKKAVEDGEITLAALKNLVNQLDKESGGDDEEKQKQGRMVRAIFGDNVTEDLLKTLKTEAEDGRKYKDDLVEGAIKARVAVQGEDFNAEGYKNMLERADVEFIKEERSTYEKLKAGKYTSGRQIGSQSEDSKDEDEVVTIR
ncbi:hypothetical protein [Enterococcus xiangfangensis]|uniref:Uncharacterized protein n=1 Tax=Enterococcus xiangfangensis TaxID=1296537 RepID=A0ABU3FB27_9ENTE|nr:hypothetical protein [Enterococcus xiangfangensis]MDT2759277.1 hypothetical protein [Enterococcus xiangfangensis]